MSLLTRAALRAVKDATKKGAKGATVKRPGQDEFLHGKPKDLAPEEKATDLVPEGKAKELAPEGEAKVASEQTKFAPEDAKLAPKDEPKFEKDDFLMPEKEVPRGVDVLQNTDGTFSIYAGGVEVGVANTLHGAKSMAGKVKAKVRREFEAADARHGEAIDVDGEAKRISELNLGEFALDESYQMNFDTVNHTDGIKAMLADQAQRNSSLIDEARRGEMKWEQTEALAQDLGVDNKVINRIMERGEGGLVNAETILAARQVVSSSAERIHTLSKKIVAGEATDINKLTFRRQLQWHAEFQREFMGARAEIGRALNAFRIPTKGDFDMDRMFEFVEAADGYSTLKIAKKIAMMDSVGAVSKSSRKYTQSKLMGTVNEMFVNSILSGPKTHFINTSGNVMMQMMNTVETAWAAQIGRFLGPGEHVQVGEAGALLHGVTGAFKDAFRLAAKSAQTGVGLDDVVKFDQVRRRSLSAEHLFSKGTLEIPYFGALARGVLDGVTIPKKVPGVGGRHVGGVGQLTRVPTERVMLPVDEFFKTLAYRSELERRAFLHVLEKLEKTPMGAGEIADESRKFLQGTKNLTAQKAAEDFTRYVTFQNPLGTVGQGFQSALRKAPVLSLLAPFVRTPVNIFTAGILDRSPLALFRAKFWRAMKEGGAERDMMLSRVSMGSATAAIVATFTVDGTITGAGPTDPHARLLLEMTGWQPYSILAGNKYHSYARMEPFAFVIGAVADSVETASYLEFDAGHFMSDEQTQINNAASAIIIGIANNTMSKTYVKGIADFTEMMSDPRRRFQGWSKTMTASLVPWAAFRAQMGAKEDPYMREAWTILDNIRVKSGITGWSENAPARRDLFGEKRLRFAGSLVGSMSPIPDRTLVHDPVLDKVVDLMEKTRKVPITMPAKRSKLGMKLTAEEYEQLTILARKFPGVDGLTFRDALSELQKSEMYTSATPHAQVDLIKEKAATYDGNARDMLYDLNPSYRKRLDEHTRKYNKLYGIEEY